MRAKALLTIFLISLSAFLAVAPSIPSVFAVTVPSGVLAYVPITMTGGSSATSASFQQVLTVNWNTYNSWLGSTVQNVEFFDSGGTVLNAWCESSCSNTATSSSVWVNLGSDTIPVSPGTLTIYLGFLSTATNNMGNTGSAVWGEYPTATGTYGQYDDGANVFSFYDNFAGTSLSSKWTTSGFSGGYPTISNGLTVTPSMTGAAETVTSVATFQSSTIIDFYGSVSQTSVSSSGSYCLESVGYGSPSIRLLATNYAGCGTGSSLTAPAGQSLQNYNGAYADSGAITTNQNQIVWSIGASSSTSYLYTSYSQVASLSSNFPSFPLPIYILDQVNSYWQLFMQWIRVRAYPPGGTMPSTSFGSLTTWATLSPSLSLTPSNNQASTAAQSAALALAATINQVLVGVTQSPSLSLSPTLAIGAVLSAAESAALSLSPTLNQGLSAITQSVSLALSPTLTALQSIAESISASISLAPTIDQDIGDITQSVSATLSSALNLGLGAVSESVSLSLSPALSTLVSFAESLSASLSLSATVNQVLAATQSASLSFVSTLNQDLGATSQDVSLTLSPALTALQSIAESISASISLSPAINQGIEAVQSASATLSSAIGQGLGAISQAVSVSLIPTVSQGLAGITQVVSVSLSSLLSQIGALIQSLLGSTAVTPALNVAVSVPLSASVSLVPSLQVAAPTSTSLSCSPSSMEVGTFTTCTAAVVGSSSPSGTVTFSTNSSTGAFVPSNASCSLSGGKCSTIYTDTSSSNATATITASYSGDPSNTASSDTFSLSVVRTGNTAVAAKSSAATVSNGQASSNQTSTTGVSVTMTGLNATSGSEIGIDTRKLTSPSAGVGAVVDVVDTNYFDVAVSGGYAGTATVCVQYAQASSSTFMEYWYNGAWWSASGVTITGTTVCGGIPVSALKGTNIYVGNPPPPGGGGGYPTMLSLTCSSSSVAVGEAVQCTAKVTGSNPSGSVAWTSAGSGSVSIQPAGCTLAQGACSVTVLGGTPGSVDVIARYSGDSQNLASQGYASLLVRYASTVSVNCSPSPVSVGSSTTCAATVSASVSPTGFVQWSNSAGIGPFSSYSCNLPSNGTCSVTVSVQHALSTTITAWYSGDSNDGAASGSFILTGTKTSTSTSVSCSPGSLAVGSSATCTATVSGYGPTGTVAWTVSKGLSIASSQTCTLSQQQGCSVTVVGVASGSANVTALYSGDQNNAGSQGQAALTVVGGTTTTTTISTSRTGTTTNTTTTSSTRTTTTSTTTTTMSPTGTRTTTTGNSSTTTRVGPGPKLPAAAWIVLVVAAAALFLFQFLLLFQWWRRSRRESLQ